MAPGRAAIADWWDRVWDRRRAVPAFKRAVRAAVFVPLAFALGHLTANPQTELMSAFGAFSLLLMVEFTGQRWVRLRSFAVLAVCGAVLVAVGTASSEVTALAVPVGVASAFAVLFVGAVSPAVAQATTGALAMVVIALAVPAPADQVPARLVGLGIGVAVAIPAAMVVWPPRSNDRLRRQMASTARAIVRLLATQRAGVGPDHRPPGMPGAQGQGDQGPEGPWQERRRELERALDQLLGLFDRQSAQPATAGLYDDRLCTVLGHLQWCAVQALRVPRRLPDDPTWRAQVLELAEASAQTLSLAARLLDAVVGGGRGDPNAVRHLAAAGVRLGQVREGRMAEAMEYLSRAHPTTAAGPSGAAGLPRVTSAETVGSASAAPGPGGPAQPSGGEWLNTELDPAFRWRALAVATEPVCRDVLVATERVARPWSRRAGDYLGAAWGGLRGYATTNSAYFRNAVRGAVAVGLAVLVVDLTSIEHGFWAVLGVLAVMRSSAASTGATALRAMVGTVLGVLAGSLVLVGVGSHLEVLWAVLPLGVFAAGVAPAVFSFTAGQGAFTVVVLILFNIIEPSGWQVGLVRLEDVAIGCVVALGVGLLFWPRGVTRLLGVNICQALAAHAAYLGAGMATVLSPGGATQAAASDQVSQQAERLLHDAFRHYLGDRGAKPVPTPHLVGLVTGAAQVRQAAGSLATLPRHRLGEEGPGPQVQLLGQELQRAANQLGGYFHQVGLALSGRQGVLPSPPLAPEPHQDLVGTLNRARASHQAGVVRTAVRLLWAWEDLRDLEGLQPALTRAATTLAQGASAPRWSMRRL